MRMSRDFLLLRPTTEAGASRDWLNVHPSAGVGFPTMKKLLLIVVLAGIGYVVFRQLSARKAEQDLWSEATSEPDLR